MKKSYRANDKTITFTFEERCGDVAGVNVIEIRDNGQFQFTHTQWAPGLIRVQGNGLYIAEQILNQVGWEIFPRATVKYGPGGRRRYVRLTDDVIDKIARVGARETRNVRESARTKEVAAFADALIGLL